MQLHSLIITGFKSFPQAKLEFPKGITAVVGPNGAGKSNVVDAILWVLGEQSTKALRSDRMEDVIFNGTESRKPLGMAEVSLVVNNVTSKELEVISGLDEDFPESKELMVTRRLYREGASEYFINKIPCRLKDVRGLFLEARAGTKGHTVIEQGNIDQILSGSPQDRRSFIEETAGIGRFKKQKTEALRKLDATEQNLLRVRDIIGEVRKHLRSLERQARQAEKYQALQQESRGLEVQLLAWDYQDLAKHRRVVEAELADGEILESSQLAEEARLVAAHEQAKSTLLSEGEKVRCLQEELTGLEHAMGEVLTTGEVARNRIEGYQRQQNQLLEEQNRLTQESRTTLCSMAELEERLSQSDSEITRHTSAVAELENQDQDLMSRRSSTDEKLDGARERMVSQQTNRAAAESRLRALQSILHEEFGYGCGGEDGVPALRKACQGIREAIAERLEVPQKFEQAIEAVLGEKIRAWVVEGTQDVEQAIAFLKKHRFGRGTFVPFQPHLIEERKFSEVPSWWPRLQEEEGVHGLALHLIHAPDEIKPALTCFLSRAIIVQDLQSAFALLPIHRGEAIDGPVFVTLEGEVIDSFGIVSGGSTGDSIGLLQRRREIRTLEQHIVQLDEEQKIRESDLEALTLLSQGLGSEASKLSNQLTETRLSLASLRERQGYNQSDLTRLKNEEQARMLRLGEIKDQIHGLLKQIQVSQEERSQAEIQFQELEQKKHSIQLDLRSSEEQYTENLNKTREVEPHLAEIRTGLSRTREKRTAGEVSLAEVRTKQQTLEQTLIGTYGQSIDKVLAEKSQGEVGQPSSDSQPEAWREQLQEIRARLDRIGPVNLAAVGEHRELEERNEFLSKQEHDMAESIKSLQEIITRLNRDTNRKFDETFKALQEKFSEVFAALFAGGKAELVLLPPEHDAELGKSMEDPGVDIVAQPPGKRLKNLSMLSGGEKALTVLALLFASFLINPSPFCILDEVDGPLDELNVVRFGKFLNQMAVHSQFIVITHNKRTMEVADSLFGVTMEEPGISKFVSVHLKELQQV